MTKIITNVVPRRIILVDNVTDRKVYYADVNRKFNLRDKPPGVSSVFTRFALLLLQVECDFETGWNFTGNAYDINVQCFPANGDEFIITYRPAFKQHADYFELNIPEVFTDESVSEVIKTISKLAKESYAWLK